MCSRRAFVATLPNRSTSSTVAEICVRPTSGSGTSTRTSASGSSAGPSSSIATPAARCAAAGAKRSRAWNVRETLGQAVPRVGQLVRGLDRRARRRPASAGRCRARRRCGRRSLRTAIARRLPPTSGSTTARWTPTGMYGDRVRQHERALQHCLRRDAVRHVDHASVGGDPCHHAVARADEVVLQPEVGEERDARSRPTTPSDRAPPRRARRGRASPPRRRPSDRPTARRATSRRRSRRRERDRRCRRRRARPSRRRARRRRRRAARARAAASGRAGRSRRRARRSGRAARPRRPRRAPARPAAGTRAAARPATSRAATNAGSIPCARSASAVPGPDRRDARQVAAPRRASSSAPFGLVTTTQS